MNRSDILDVIQIKISKIKESALVVHENDYIDFRGTGLNSIELMTLLVYLEEYFDFESDDEDLNLEKIILVSDLIDLVKRFV